MDFEKIIELKENAIKTYIPIIRDDLIKFLKEYFVKNNVKKVLEIGSAIGYSSIVMASFSSDIHIDTIERDSILALNAISNIKDFGLENQINLINADALTLELDTNNKYDLIFIDASKTKYIDFFNKYKTYLNNNGSIISDNMNLHDVTNMEFSKRKQRLRKKINEYIAFLNNLTSYKTTYMLNIGDGIAISVLNDEFNN
ncbi:MAG: class I SAM-dependent methyltransferase [Acholeplasmatales bacterium]|nr:class I SAM-dependent methyltransferase [Acholeplasmatales bacterium]